MSYSQTPDSKGLTAAVGQTLARGSLQQTGCEHSEMIVRQREQLIRKTSEENQQKIRD
jgi:hypothetical protein